MSQIEFRPIGRDNWRDCIRLKVKDEQKGFVAPNDYSLLQAHYEAENRSVPYGIYLAGAMIGFVMSSQPDEMAELGAIYLHRFMVGAEHQGKGYGKIALKAFIARLKEEDRYTRIFLSYEPENTRAAQLYASLGFKELGISKALGNEMKAELVLTDVESLE